MVRFSAAAAGFVLVGGALFGLGEVIPVDHREPMTVRVLDGRTGLPLAHLRLVLVAGYDEHDLARRLWLDEVATDASGEVPVPRSLVNFPYMVVSLKKAKPCSFHIVFNMGRIRNLGLDAPNRCGTGLHAEGPGVLTIFARAGTAAAPGVPAAKGFLPPPRQTTDWQDSGGQPDAPPELNFIQLATELTQPPNELETLRNHAPADERHPFDVRSSTQAPTIPTSQGALGPVPQDSAGTDDSFDAYQEMCLPER
jgi:hypothetical protein